MCCFPPESHTFIPFILLVCRKRTYKDLRRVPDTVENLPTIRADMMFCMFIATNEISLFNFVSSRVFNPCLYICEQHVRKTVVFRAMWRVVVLYWFGDVYERLLQYNIARKYSENTCIQFSGDQWPQVPLNFTVLNQFSCSENCHFHRSFISAGLVPKRSGQVQEEPATAGEHRCGQGVRRLHAAGWDAVRPSLRNLQRLHEPLQHPHHPDRLDQPYHAHCHLCAYLGAGRHRRPRVSEPITDHTDQPLLMVRARRHSLTPPQLLPRLCPSLLDLKEHCWLLQTLNGLEKRR